MSRFHIEGTIRHQDNIIKAMGRYGNMFKGQIINTKYFNDDDDIPTLVCKGDPTIILGKPRWGDSFRGLEGFNIHLVKNPFGLWDIQIRGL